MENRETLNLIDNEKNNNKWSLKKKICIGILIGILIILKTIIIIVIVSVNNLKEILKKAGYDEPWNDLYGNKIINIPYFKDNKIINTFKKNGKNYKEEIGDINNGNDYEKNVRNYYNLFIPYSSTKQKDKYNQIMLFIHGGAWIGGEKENIEHLCSRYAKMGFITATMSHTLLVEKYKQYNIFRILDEITSCIESIKEELKKQDFNVNKLEMAIGGISSGGHLSLLYSYSMVNTTSIPIKFVIDFVGPVSLEPEFWYKVAKDNVTLENIEPNDIDKALKDKSIVKVFDDDCTWVGMMNLFLGKRYSDNELKEMCGNKKINVDNEKYKNLNKSVKYAYPFYFINKDTIPTLCEYAGNDMLVGVAQYAKMKELSQKYGNNLVLIYMRYGGHGMESYYTENGLYAMREMHYQILNFSKTYFTHNE